MTMIVVVPFCGKDRWLAVKNLEWCIEMEGPVPFKAVLHTDLTEFDDVRRLASKYFAGGVEISGYSQQTESMEWPFPQNWAFAKAAWHAYHYFKEPWLWWETDSTPMHPGWLQRIWEEYQRGGKPFMSHYSERTGVFNGVAVYPRDVSRYSQKAMTACLVRTPSGKQNPWDVWASPEVVPHMHKANHIFQHEWFVDGAPATFPDWDSVGRIVRPGVALFHRCKDGTLIDRLRARGKTVLVYHNREIGKDTNEKIETKKAESVEEANPAENGQDRGGRKVRQTRVATSSAKRTNRDADLFEKVRKPNDDNGMDRNTKPSSKVAQGPGEHTRVGGNRGADEPTPAEVAAAEGWDDRFRPNLPTRGD